VDKGVTRYQLAGSLLDPDPAHYLETKESLASEVSRRVLNWCE
jgi:hypothetical protein